MSSPSRPVTELDKSDVLSGLFDTWDSLDGLLTGLSEQQWQTPTPLPGWTVHNVIAHIIGTESALHGISTPEADIDVSTLAHVRNDVGVANECWVRHLSAESGADVHQRFRTLIADRRKRLSDMAIDDWNAPTLTPLARTAMGGSCGCGSSTAGCMSTTSGMRWTSPLQRPSWQARRHG